jgi:hypothetical protein
MVLPSFLTYLSRPFCKISNVFCCRLSQKIESSKEEHSFVHLLNCEFQKANDFTIGMQSNFKISVLVVVRFRVVRKRTRLVSFLPSTSWTA